jgi:hypothetical protein
VATGTSARRASSDISTLLPLFHGKIVRNCAKSVVSGG